MNTFIKQFNTGYMDGDKALAISPRETALIVSILSAGTFFGALLAAPAADWIGRRMSLIVSIAVFCFGVIFQVCASRIPMLLCGRCVKFRSIWSHLVASDPFLPKLGEDATIDGIYL